MGKRPRGDPEAVFLFRSCGVHERQVTDFMTLITPNDGEDASSELMLSVTQEHFQRAVGKLNGLINKWEAGEFDAPVDAQRVVRDASALLVLALKERERLEEHRRKKAGVVHDYAIDFGSARDEIGRRMALLRTARGAGAVSE